MRTSEMTFEEYKKSFLELQWDFYESSVEESAQDESQVEFWLKKRPEVADLMKEENWPFNMCNEEGFKMFLEDAKDSNELIINQNNHRYACKYGIFDKDVHFETVDDWIAYEKEQEEEIEEMQ